MTLTANLSCLIFWGKNVTNAAAIQADYRIIKPVAGRGCYILQLEVPWEAFDEVNRILGAPPKPGENRWVGVALLNSEVAHARINSKSNEIDEKVPPNPPKGAHGDYAAKLYKSGFFLNQAVCEALGTDGDFLAWIRTQPSCIDGDEYNIEACHVRRAANSGTGIKPKYSAIPLTHDQHFVQHHKGELICLTLYLKNPDAGILKSKDWFWKQRCHYIQEWGKVRLKEHFKAESLADIWPGDIKVWAAKNDLEKYLPRVTSGDEEIPI